MMRVVFAHKKWENDLLLWCFFPHITYVHFWQSILKSVWPFQQHYPPWVVAWQIPNQQKFYFFTIQRQFCILTIPPKFNFFRFSTRVDRLFEWHHCLQNLFSNSSSFSRSHQGCAADFAQSFATPPHCHFTTLHNSANLCIFSTHQLKFIMHKLAWMLHLCQHRFTDVSINSWAMPGNSVRFTLPLVQLPSVWSTGPLHCVQPVTSGFHAATTC